MKYWTVVCERLPAQGMALYPFILIKDEHRKEDVVLINHEKIHLRQQLELAIIPFYLFYLINYLINVFRYKNHHLAYVNILFEREAYKHERNLTYLRFRKFCEWWFSNRSRK